MLGHVSLHLYTKADSGNKANGCDTPSGVRALQRAAERSVHYFSDYFSFFFFDFFVCEKTNSA